MRSWTNLSVAATANCFVWPFVPTHSTLLALRVGIQTIAAICGWDCLALGCKRWIKVILACVMNLRFGGGITTPAAHTTWA
jgi:hypothetical protein